MTDSCGCWTDEDGYWQLSEKCRQDELAVWSRAVNINLDIEQLQLNRRTPHDIAVAYFRQELRDNVE